MTVYSASQRALLPKFSPIEGNELEWLERQIREGLTPAAYGYRMPAEWEPHWATWLSWPHNPHSWPGRFEGIASIWARLVRELRQVEGIRIAAGTGDVLRQAQEMVGDLPNVELFDIPTNDAWMRDHGPIFLISECCQPPLVLVDWRYNAWGNKYPPYDLDNLVPRQIAERLGYYRFVVPLVLEGGAVDTDGRGTLLAARNCLLNPNRNPYVSQEFLSECLKAFFGVARIIWVEAMIAGDDTDGHVDQLARFVGPRVVVVASEQDPADINYGPLRELWRQLSAAEDAEGRPVELIPIPMPRPIEIENQRVPASYLNFYIANQLVIVPAFDDPADVQAQNILGRLFPGRRVVGLPARDLCWGLGAYHCITQQEPAPPC